MVEEEEVVVVTEVEEEVRFQTLLFSDSFVFADIRFSLSQLIGYGGGGGGGGYGGGGGGRW